MWTYILISHIRLYCVTFFSFYSFNQDINRLRYVDYAAILSLAYEHTINRFETDDRCETCRRKHLP